MELIAEFPDEGYTVSALLPDGDEQKRIIFRKCKCGCGQHFQFQTAAPHQRFVNEAHQKAFHNDKQPRKTRRVHKK